MPVPFIFPDKFLEQLFFKSIFEQEEISKKKKKGKKRKKKKEERKKKKERNRHSSHIPVTKDPHPGSGYGSVTMAESSQEKKSITNRAVVSVNERAQRIL